MDTLRYELMSPRACDELIDCVQSTFPAPRGEVMARALDLGEDEYFEYTKLVCAKAVEDSMTVVARDSDERMVGFLISEDFTTAPLYSKKPIHPKFKPLTELLETLDARYRARRERSFSPGEGFHMYMLGVLPAFARQGVAMELAKHALLLGQSRGFRIAIAEATGPHSQKLVYRLGFKTKEEIVYGDFVFEGVRVFSGVTSVEGCRLAEKELVELTKSS